MLIRVSFDPIEETELKVGVGTLLQEDAVLQEGTVLQDYGIQPAWKQTSMETNQHEFWNGNEIM